MAGSGSTFDRARFKLALAQTESTNQAFLWGDSGRACGRWQMHPSFYCDWGPMDDDFGDQEHDWNWAFEKALDAFLDECLRKNSRANELEVAMAFHLHGQPVFSGFDPAYAARFARMWAVTPAKLADS